MGETIDSLSEYESAQKAINALKQLLKTVNISYKLSEYGVSQSQVPKLVNGAQRQARLFAPNPRDLGEGDIRKIYQNTIG